MIEVLDVNSNFLAIPKNYSSCENSEIAIVSAPYEKTTSYGKGAAKGPRAILDASAYVEFFDEEFERELCFEKGIASIKPLEFEGDSDEEDLKFAEDLIASLLKRNKFVATLGGEHTVSLAPIKAHFEKYPDLTLLHFDAHADLREEYEDNPYSHASVMARVAEFFPPERIAQVGIRALCKEEYLFIKQNGVKTFFAHKIRAGDFGENWQKAVAEACGDKIYVSFDFDFFDPSIIPATGTPEPNGFFYSETLDVFREITKLGKTIVGFDAVELAPIKGLSHPDFTAARFVYKLLNFAFYKK